MVEKRFDTLNLDMAGDISVVVKDTDDTPNEVLQLNKDWSVDVDWHLLGPAVTAIDGDWLLKVSMESLGEGYEGNIQGKDILDKDLPPIEIELEAQVVDSTLTDRHWKKTVKAGPSIPNVPGVYKVVALVSYQTEWDIPLPMAGFAEADLISFYKAA
jgi:hypothetical protein